MATTDNSWTVNSWTDVAGDTLTVASPQSERGTRVEVGITSPLGGYQMVILTPEQAREAAAELLAIVGEE